MTVMRVLLFVWNVSKCDGDGNASVETGKVWLW